MPIKPENKHRYPPDWPQVRQRILQRAGNRCEECGVPNHAWGWRDAAGKFHRVSKRPLIEAMRRGREWVKPPFTIGSVRGPLKIIEIVLTIAHLDHQPEVRDESRLRAWCQRCHLAYDQAHHKESAYMTRRANRNTMELPL